MPDPHDTHKRNHINCSPLTTMADEAAEFSKQHQIWIVAYLKEHGGSATYHEVVEEGEKHHCDTLGAMLKILKNRKVIKYDQMFLMYPMHGEEVITLIDENYVP
eukprot:m.1637694 g.1637694  ORF g.1637694 m.1637694 type:complete len:104 (-) comp26024_c0_seq1:189-500(-)